MRSLLKIFPGIPPLALVSALRPRRSGVAADVLSALDDDFSGGSLDPKWTLVDTSPSSSPAVSVVSGEAGFTIAGGGSNGSFQFNANDAARLIQRVTGAFDARARCRVRNSAGTGNPATSAFRQFGLIFFDTATGNQDEVHSTAGSANIANSAAEWKTTDTNDSTFGFVDTGTALLDVDFRLVRDPTNLQIFRTYYRFSSASADLLGDDGWVLLQEVNRGSTAQPTRPTATPMAETGDIGLVLYAQPVTHDIRGYCSEFRVRTP